MPQNVHAWLDMRPACRSPHVVLHDLLRQRGPVTLDECPRAFEMTMLAQRGREPTARCLPRFVAMKLTGHKTVSVYRRYAIADDRDLRVAVERLDLLATK